MNADEKSGIIKEIVEKSVEEAEAIIEKGDPILA